MPISIGLCAILDGATDPFLHRSIEMHRECQLAKEIPYSIKMVDYYLLEDNRLGMCITRRVNGVIPDPFFVVVRLVRHLGWLVTNFITLIAVQHAYGRESSRRIRIVKSCMISRRGCSADRVNLDT